MINHNIYLLYNNLTNNYMNLIIFKLFYNLLIYKKSFILYFIKFNK